MREIGATRGEIPPVLREGVGEKEDIRGGGEDSLAEMGKLP